MFHSRRTNNKINNLHEKALRIINDDDVSTFDQLLAMGKSFCIHHQNIHRLLIKIYKALHNISESILKELFVFELNLWWRQWILFSKILWFRNLEFMTIKIREDHSILSFVTKIKQWKPIDCPCTVCKSYIVRVGCIKVSDY